MDARSKVREWVRALCSKLGVGAVAVVAACSGSTGGDDASSCKVGDKTYQPGESFSAGCNSCVCDDQGRVACTTAWCGGCSYGGVAYETGDTFPAADGCNSCACEAGGDVSCTQLSDCGCNPAEEWWREYLSPAQCDIPPNVKMPNPCPEHTEVFFNSCGCGCEQAQTCPESIDCTASGDCQAELEACPYSQAPKGDQR